MKTLLYNALIVTQNKTREIIKRGFIVIENNKIIKIGRDKFVGDTLGFDEVFDIKGKVITPGFVNAHVHFGETIYEDFLPEKFTLEEYLAITNLLIKNFPFIEKYRKTVSDYTVSQIIKSGTTTVVGGRVDKVSNDWGIRSVSGYMVMDNCKLKKYYSDIEKSFDSEMKNFKEIAGNLSSLGIFIHSLNYVDEDALLIIAKILKKTPDLPLMIHIAETKKQENEVLEKFGMTSVEVLEKYGMLSGHTLLVHANWCTEKDLEVIKNSGASVVHCLSSNIKVADRVMDISRAIENNINICIATDGFCTSKTFSVLEEARKVLNYNVNKVGSEITEQMVLDMITVNAADALRIFSETGSIEIGKRADLAFLDISGDSMKSDENIISLVINDGVAEGLMVDGRLIMWDKRMSMKDDKKIVDSYSSLIKKIQEGTNENDIGKSAFWNL